MKNILRLLSCCLLFFIFPNNTFAQVKMTKIFSKKLDQMDLVFSPPLENSYKKIKAGESIVVDFDFEIKARKADMTIGFALFPEGKNAMIFPHIKVSNIANLTGTFSDWLSASR